MKKLIGKGSLRYCSGGVSARYLEEVEENLVAGTVMELLKNEERCALMGQVFDSKKAQVCCGYT